MEGKSIKSTVLKSTLLFVVAYAAFWLGGGLIISSVDAIYEYVKDVKYVDGWTPGMMFWSLSLYALPVIFVLSLILVIIWKMIFSSGTRES